MPDDSYNQLRTVLAAQETSLHEIEMKVAQVFDIASRMNRILEGNGRGTFAERISNNEIVNKHHGEKLDDLDKTMGRYLILIISTLLGVCGTLAMQLLTWGHK